MSNNNQVVANLVGEHTVDTEVMSNQGVIGRWQMKFGGPVIKTEISSADYTVRVLLGQGVQFRGTLSNDSSTLIDAQIITPPEGQSLSYAQVKLDSWRNKFQSPEETVTVDLVIERPLLVRVLENQQVKVDLGSGRQVNATLLAWQQIQVTLPSTDSIKLVVRPEQKLEMWAGEYLQLVEQQTKPIQGLTIGSIGGGRFGL